MPQSSSGLVAQRITRLTTDQKIAGSNPAEIEFFVSQFCMLFLKFHLALAKQSRQ